MRPGRRLLISLLMLAAIVVVPTASAAKPLGIGQAKHYLAEAERQSVAVTPEYVAFRSSWCHRLTPMRVSCALIRWFEGAEYAAVQCRSRVTIYLRGGHVRFHPTRKETCRPA